MQKTQQDSARNQTCGCCGGSMPPLEIWEANRSHADECTGGVDEHGRCFSYSRESLWRQKRKQNATD